ncbi:MAG: ABC transporter permease [Anaerolineae bacterium]|jgi:ABC-2 type transport system permease protein
MNKTFLVFRHELATTFRRRSYLLIGFGLPILAAVVVIVISFLRGDEDPSAGAQNAPLPPAIQIEGYVDQSGLIRFIPDAIPSGRLRSYPSEELAQEALAVGQITAYYLIPADYVQRGELYYVYPDSKPLLSDGQEWVILRTLVENLVDDPELASIVWDPIHLEWTSLAPSAQPGNVESNEVVQFLPAVMVILLFVSFMMSANLLSENVSSEKENRTMEILMVSISPRQMLVGKVAALGAAGLVQTIVWVGTAYLMINLGGTTLALPEGFSIPASILFWGVVFYLLGYAVYGSLMAGVGALTPRLKEAGQASFVILSPLLIGYIVGLLAPMAGDTEAVLPVVLSIVPLTAPVLMMMRLTDGSVPLWQLLLSAALMLGTAYLIIRAVAAMFHAQNLLSGQPFSPRRFFRALLGRA